MGRPATQGKSDRRGGARRRGRGHRRIDPRRRKRWEDRARRRPSEPALDQTLLRSIRMATLDLRCDLAARRVIAALERCAGLSGTNHWETQPRDDHGRWTDGPGVGSADDAPVVPVAGFDFGLVDLREEEAAGGHAISEHVGKSDEALLMRVRNSVVEGLFTTSSYRRDGSFPSIEAANKLVNATLAQNRPYVEDVANGILDRSPLLVGYFDSPTGREACRVSVRSAPYVRVTTGVGVVIVWSAPRPWSTGR